MCLVLDLLDLTYLLMQSAYVRYKSVNAAKPYFISEVINDYILRN
jgi:hypothetical protein